MKSDSPLLHFLESSLFTQIVAIEDCKFVRVSDSFARMFGYSRQELLGMDALELVDPSGRQLLIDAVREPFRRDSIRLESCVRKKDGSLFFVEFWVARGLGMENGLWLVTSFADITDRKREEKVVYEIQERFRTAFSYAAVGMSLVGINGRILDANYAMCETLGYDEQQLCELTFQSCLAADDLERYLEACTSLLIAEIPCAELELKLCHKEGSIVWGLLNATLVRDDIGKPLYYILQLQNVTKRKEAEELLRKSDKLNAVGQLAAGVAHEVRNPLTVLKGFTQMLQTSDSKNGEYYRLMLSEVERIEVIIGEFLGLAKPKETLLRENDLCAILRDVAALIETKAIMNNVIIASDVGDRSIPIQCDENQLKQVFINIMQNAVEAMPTGGTVTLSVESVNGLDVVVRIADEGCGISQERLARLGEPFYSSKEKGTGLGLMVSYQIVQKHRGLITVMSKVNEGTQFEITLPLLQRAGSLA